MNDETRARLEEQIGWRLGSEKEATLAAAQIGGTAIIDISEAIQLGRDIRDALAEIDRLRAERDAILNWLIVESYTSDPKWSVRLPDGLVHWHYTREQAVDAIRRAAGLEPEGR